MINKIKNNTIKIFYCIMVLLFSYLFINIIFFNNTAISKVDFLSLIIGVIIYIFCTLVLYKLYNKIKTKKVLVTIIFCISFFIFQLIFSYVFTVLPSWDFGAVYDSVINSLGGSEGLLSNVYYYRYSNNIGMAILLKIVFSIFNFIGVGKSHLLYVGIVFNILMIDVSIFYLYRISNILFNKKTSNFFLICTLFITPFITYCPIFYTDTLSMPFSIMAIYYFIKFYMNDNKKIYLVLCGFLLGIGTCIKFTVIITLIALIIFMFLAEEKIRKKTIDILILSMVTLTPYISLNFIENKIMDRDLVDLEKFPITHWIMMGLNKSGEINGSFSYDDVAFTESFETINEKKENNIRIIKQRIEKYIKNNELAEFYTKKAVYVWGDGSFYAPEKLKRHPVRNLKIKNAIIGNEKQSKIYYVICQVQVTLFCLFTILAVIFRKRLDDKQRKILLITSLIIFGNFMFFMIWEARSRYLVNFLPVFLIQVYLGIMATTNYLSEKRSLKNERRS